MPWETYEGGNLFEAEIGRGALLKQRALVVLSRIGYFAAMEFSVTGPIRPEGRRGELAL